MKNQPFPGRVSVFLPCQFPVFHRKDPGTFAKQFRKAARGGVADHLRDLSHGKICVDRRMLRLAHPALLDILRDRTAGQLLKGRFRLGRAHAGDPGEPVQWNLKRIMVIQICDDICKLCRILCGQLFFFSVGELLFRSSTARETASATSASS